jgi:hypothetical protein
MIPHRFYRGRVLERQLRTLYEEKGKLPDMTRFEHDYHRRTTRVLFGIITFLFVLVAASWAGFLLFSKGGEADTEVALTFDGPQVVVSGTPQAITLRYKNRDRNPVGLSLATWGATAGGRGVGRGAAGEGGGVR